MVAERTAYAGLVFSAFGEDALVPLADGIRSVSGYGVSIDDLRHRAQQSAQWNDHGIEFGISESGPILGIAQVRTCPVAYPPNTFQVGILIFAAENRTRGIGRRTLFFLRDYLFRERSAVRVWFTTDDDNYAMRRIGEQAGFRLEGMQRGTNEIDGRLRDSALYALTRDDVGHISA